jgi:ClpP class serine protease
LINNYQEKKKKEYNKKRQFLKDECYKVFLPKVLEKRNSKEIDFPNFVYEKRLAICSEALDLAEKAVFMTERIYGRKHIEKCYSIKIKQNLRNKKN